MSLHPVTDAYRCARMHPRQEALVGRLMLALSGMEGHEPGLPPDKKDNRLAQGQVPRTTRGDQVMAMVTKDPGITPDAIRKALGVKLETALDIICALAKDGKAHMKRARDQRRRDSRCFPGPKPEGAGRPFGADRGVTLAGPVT